MRSVFFLSTFKRASTCKRLCLTGSILAMFLLTLVIGNSFIAKDRSVTRQMLGHDFLAFYTAGSFVRQGRVHELYNLDSVRDFEQSTAKAAGLEVGKSFGPWWNPPFYALIFEPLAALPYGTALDIWRWISVFAVMIAIALLTYHVGSASRPWQWKHAGLVPLLVLISMPFVQAISHGQNTFISLLLLTLTTLAWRGEKRFIAGVAAGLLFYKPQLGAVVAAAMVVDLGWASLGGLCVTGTILLATTLIALPGSLGDWLHQLPANVRWMQVDHAYLWERHVTLKAFWRLLLQGREAGEATLLTSALTYLSMGIITAGLVASALRLRQNDAVELRPLHRDRLITATITAMPLLMPFYFDYDLLLLAVPLTLYAIERISHPQFTNSTDARFTLAWTSLFAWLYFNPAIALHTHVSGTVILLTGTAILSIQRAMRKEILAAPVIVQHPQPLAMAA
jgi:Glycosyltransferase family 87